MQMSSRIFASHICEKCPSSLTPMLTMSIFYCSLLLLFTFLVNHQPSMASHGIRQRNSSVPLRQVVEKSKSYSTALILVANNGSAALPAPVGRHATRAEECAHCDANKCAQTVKTGPGICVVARTAVATADDLLWERCIPSAMELDKLLRHGLVPPSKNAQQRIDASGCSQPGGEDGGREGVERICWCQAPSSLFTTAEDAGSKEWQALHARRRKNHHGRSAAAGQSKARTAAADDGTKGQGTSAANDSRKWTNPAFCFGSILLALILAGTRSNCKRHWPFFCL